jgi:hypothetical protein
MLRICEFAGIPFALSFPTYKIGFPGWPEPILDSVTGIGASIEKKGACTSPLFHFPARVVVHPLDGTETSHPTLTLAKLLPPENLHIGTYCLTYWFIAVGIPDRCLNLVLPFWD